MKAKIVLLFLSIFFITSCNENNDNVQKNSTSPLSQFIQEARKGFSFKGERKQIVTNLNNEELFTNIYEYDYSFENSLEATRTYQKYSYYLNGKEENIELNFSKDEEGFLSQEYINYKNEVDYFRVTDTEGNYMFYDELFINPFHLVEEEDFIKIEDNIYKLNSLKDDLFDYYLSGSSYSIKELRFYLDENGFNKIDVESINYSGKTKDDELNKYIPVNINYKAEFILKDLGSTYIDGAILSNNKENNELKNILTKVNDNFTLETRLIEVSTKQEIMPLKTSFFDGESYYISVNSDENLKDDFLYTNDPFKEDELFYEYAYNENLKLFTKTDKLEEYNYNIDPKKREFFIPKLKDINVSLFSDEIDEDGYYFIENEYALAFIGCAFLSEAENLPYFIYGYGLGAKIREINDEIEIIISFYYPYDSTTVLLLDYEVKYKDIDNTVVPIVDF